MSKKSADYDKKSVTDLNDFYPANLKNDFVDNLNETLFNRFLTKQDYQPVIGAIGVEDLESSIRNILEKDLFSQKNQLQPILNASVANNELYLTWEDFIRKLGQQDVDVDNFDKWGSVIQFNWVPPIDLDKFINFRDYYWDSSAHNIKVPDYVTIKNNDIASEMVLNSAIKSAATSLLDGTLLVSGVAGSSVVSIEGNYPVYYGTGLLVIVKYVDGSYEHFKIVSSVFNVITSRTDITLDSVLRTDATNIISTDLTVVRDSIEHDKLYVSGIDLTDFLYEDMVIATLDGNRVILNSVKSSEYNRESNRTYIVLNNVIDFPITKISIAPIINLAIYANKRFDGFDSLDATNVDVLYQLIWLVRVNKVSSSLGSLSISNNILTDFSADFISSNVQIGDTIEINMEGGYTIKASVTSVSATQLEYVTNDLPYIYSSSELDYSIYRTTSMDDFLTEPAAPSNNDVWLSLDNDALYYWNGSTWIDHTTNVSLLIDMLDVNKFSYENNDWSSVNSWVHKSQLTTVTGKIQAQLPIIEFDNKLELADMSVVTHNWSYRKDSALSFTESTVHPKTAEIFNLEIVSEVDFEFIFQSLTRIVFDSKYGNMTDCFSAGSQIVLTGFATNNGTYNIESSEYTQLSPTGQKVTIITLTAPLSSTSDIPLGAKIHPRLTSYGDAYVSPYIHWRYDGVDNISSSSYKLNHSDIDSIILGASTTSKYGHRWQSFSYVTGNSQANPVINLAPNLHSLSLYDDYQEGDIRVYINKKRQYGNFIEIPSYIDDRFVGGIQFIDGTVLSTSDTLLIEVGAYSELDFGREAVVVNTPSGYELTNLTRYRKVEQVKTESSQNPEFVVLDAKTKENYITSSKIFSYVENQSNPTNPYILKKLELSSGDNKSYVFQQHLFDADKMLAYKFKTNLNYIAKTIWRRGENFEHYLPNKNSEGKWNIPNNWYFNPHHENRKVNSYIDLYTHFRSIINSQKQIGMLKDRQNVYRSDFNINYGLGGTIKEHNGNLDILASFIFNDSVTIEELIEFAKQQYVNSLFKVENILIDNIVELIENDATTLDSFTESVLQSVVDIFESDSRWSFLYGDSSMFVNGVGIRNWILTAPMMGFGKNVAPHKLSDEALQLGKVVHHDGHIASYSVAPAIREKLFLEIISKYPTIIETVTSDAQPLPSIIAIGDDVRGVVFGDMLLRTNTTTRERLLYKFNGTSWFKINFSELLLDVIVGVEQKLYDVVNLNNYNQNYKLDNLLLNPKFDEKTEKQFLKYAASTGVIDPLSIRETFSQNNPYTWNYYYSTPTYLPTTEPYVNYGDWRKIYEHVFGTAYPHLEPWKLQGYQDKPSWWEEEYRVDGAWASAMWDDILVGRVINGKALPSGALSTYVSGEVQGYSYLPVVTINETADGYTYGQLLPPYWNSVNNNGVSTIRSLFDPNSGDEMVKPNVDYSFGQYGDFEVNWETNISYVYDMMIVAFKLDPINFVSGIFGYDKFSVDCLELHTHSYNIQPGNRTIFHGETYNGTRFRADGLNQWLVNFNRYQDYDSFSSGFNTLWKQSEMRLGYVFDTMIDSASFDIRSLNFDLTEKDYKVKVKNTKDYDIKYLDSLILTLLSSPSKYVGDTGKGWTVEISTIPTLKRNIKYFSTQNYSTTLVGDVFKVNSDRLTGIVYNQRTAYGKIGYNNSLRLTTPLNLITGNQYTVDVTIGTINHTLSLIAEAGDTVESLITYLNNIFTNGYIDLELGDLSVRALNDTDTITISGTLFESIASYNTIEYGVTNATFGGALMVKGNKTTFYTKDASIEVNGSTLFDGTYTISDSDYDIKSDTTLLIIKEDISIPNTIVIDGAVTLVGEIGIHSSWETGTEVYLNSYEQITGLSLERPYYLIKIDETTFKLALSKASALNNKPMTTSDITISSPLYVGKLERTFKANGGANTKINWRVHAIDERIIKELYDGVSISGMQNVVDFLEGFSAYNRSNGFGLSNFYKDADTGRPYDWDLFIENFIDWCVVQRTIRQESKMEYGVVANGATSEIEFSNGKIPNWANGTSVIINGLDGATTPSELALSSISDVPYYVIRTTSQNSIKLATSAFNAARGIHVDFSDDSTGKIYLQVFEKFENKPAFLFNPFSEYLTLTHDIGLSSNIFTDGNYVYGMDGVNLDSSKLFVSRRDNQTDISLLGIVKDYNRSTSSQQHKIAGAKISIQTFEHVLTFLDYSVNGDLIYDKFLGLKTPRFILEFGRPTVKTMRPTVGGYVLLDNNLVQNIESSIDDSRYYYDDIKARDGKNATDILRKSLGYDGPKDYMTDIGINAKAQFTFWKSMIQNKGTNLAVNAFTNQTGLSGAEVDEFWAYKLGTFGGTKQLEYPEVKLLAEDVNKDELRLEFIPPNNIPLDATFTAISLTDVDRWWNQPDQLKSMVPYDSFFISTTTNSTITDVSDKVIDINGRTVLPLSVDADSALISFKENNELKLLTEQTDYKFINTRLIEFTTQKALEDYVELTVNTLTYDFATQNPSKIIDKKNGIVVSEVPFWNPAYGQFDLKYVAPVDRFGVEDIASYTNNLDRNYTPENNIWLSDRVGFIWVDTRNMGYLPYYDKSIMPNINDRIFNWGKLAEWSDFEVYQWTASKYTPVEWDEISKQQINNFTIPDEQKISGNVRKVLYRNDGFRDAPIWVKEEDVHLDVIAGLLDENSTLLYGDNIEVYINGRYVYSREINTVDTYIYIQNTVPLGTYLHFIKKAHVPTTQELIELAYAYDTPHCVETRINPRSGNEEKIYYFWVYGKSNKIKTAQIEHTLVGIKNGITQTTSPYMIPQGLRPSGSGYGMVYGNIFDEFGYELPFRYTQVVVKGLEGTVKDDSRYTLRFTKDYNLRDRLDKDSLEKKNVHTEWKLFREKQYNKVDRYLWNKLIEALIGYNLKAGSDSEYNSEASIPALNRTVYDNIFGTDTRIGLGEGQVFIDKVVAIDTVKYTIENEIINYVSHETRDFLLNINYGTPESIIVAYNEIYNSLDVSLINKIFFDALHVAFSFKKEFAEIFKTSWVALQISQNVSVNGNGNNILVHSLEEGNPCAEYLSDDDEIAPPIFPPVTPTPTVTVTPTPSSTPSTIDECGSEEVNRELENGDGRSVEDESCRDIESNMSMR